MDCPRCDGSLERYALAGREAVYCEGCGYIGVPVEHRGELREVESWDDAVSRFHEVNRVEAGTVETRDDPPPAVESAGGAEEPEPTVVRVESSGIAPDVGGANGESAGTAGHACDVCGKRFETRAQLDGHSAVHSDREE